MRKRTRISLSKGSMWMSLARSLTACWSSEFTSRMIGASSAASSRSCGSCEPISEASAIEIFGGVERERFGGGRAAIVDVVDGVEDRAAAREFRLDLGAVEEQAQIVDGVGVEGIGDGDVQRCRRWCARAAGCRATWRRRSGSCRRVRRRCGRRRSGCAPACRAPRRARRGSPALPACRSRSARRRANSRRLRRARARRRAARA